MIQRDLKIGLVLGLVIVAGLVFKLAIDPRLSTEARMKDIIASKEGQGNNEILNEVPFKPYSEALYEEEQENLNYEEPVIEVAEQNNNENNYPALQQQLSPEPTPPPIQQPIEIPEPVYVEEEIVNEPEVIVEPEPEPEVEVEVVKKTQRIHVIEKDQTLSSISKLYYGSPNKWQIIVDANPDVIKNPNKIKPGMKIVIP